MGILLYVRQGYTRFARCANNPAGPMKQLFESLTRVQHGTNPKRAANSIALQYPAKCDRHFPPGLVA